MIVDAERAIVAGAGPAGLTAAIALRRAGLDAVVYERRPDLSEIGAAVTLWPNALHGLDLLGLGTAVRAAGAAIDGLAIRSWRGRTLDATGPELMRERFGSGLVIHRADLQRVLADALGRERIRVGAGLRGVRDDLAELDDGSRLRARLIVGADGIHSTARRAVAPRARLRRATYSVWRGVTRFEVPEPIGVLSMGRGAQFGWFPMTGGRVYWFASLDTPPGGPRPAHADLRAAFAGWHDPIPAMLAAIAPDEVIVTDVYDSAPIRRRAAGSVVLVGDAAHPSAPTLGQGACQAIEDAVVLGRCVAAAGDVRAAVREYERLRRGRTNAMMRVARGMGSMGQWSSRPACRIRDLLIARTPTRLRMRNLDWMFSFDPGPPAAGERAAGGARSPIRGGPGLPSTRRPSRSA